MGRPAPETRWLFSCEHGGRGVPAEYAALFLGCDEILASHRGWDPGALEVFGALAPELADAAFEMTTTRLLVDVNRSLEHPRVFSEFTRPLGPAARAAIADRWWRPWRAAVAGQVEAWLAAGHRVQHLSIHSFTPVLAGRIRTADLGLLYDPANAGEREFCARWQGLLAKRGWRVRRNYPYLGKTDGHTTALRRRFPAGYAGVELEINQALFPGMLQPLCTDLGATLAELKIDSRQAG